jgi:catechol 2,3-dioxygenase-like lactoylglutathione lyase family enzyme
MIAAQLPLKTTGIEHVSLWVDDVQQAGDFFGQVFNPALHKEKDPPLRYYVPLSPQESKSAFAYLAIGAARGRPVQMDHFCVLVHGYNAGAMAERLKQEGVQISGSYGVYPDQDGLQLQMLTPPAGLAPSTEPAKPVSEAPPIVQPLGLENVILQVSDLDRSAAYYQKLFSGKTTRQQGMIWIDVAGTRLGLAAAPPGGKAVISSFCVKVKPFDRKAVSKKLEMLGAQVVPAGNAGADVLRFKSPMGIQVDMKRVRT